METRTLKVTAAQVERLQRLWPRRLGWRSRVRPTGAAVRETRRAMLGELLPLMPQRELRRTWRRQLRTFRGEGPALGRLVRVSRRWVRLRMWWRAT